MTQFKLCKQCGKEKKISEFNKDKKTKDGLYYVCKTCRRHNKLIDKGYSYNRITGDYYKFVGCKKCGVPFAYTMKRFNNVPKYCRNCRK